MTRPQGTAPSFDDEAARVARRRDALGTGEGYDGGDYALALSGGGIRSATFSLGVMQALCKVPVPPVHGADDEEPPHLPDGTPPTADRRPFHDLLSRFDYLSSVSGGGYTGSFFCSLFVPQRLDTSEDAASHADPSVHAAQLAHLVMTNDPPGRMRIEAEDDRSALCRRPLAWLRENGRYLAPTGAGDIVYAGALALRNWLAIQYVLATIIIAGLAVLMLGRAVVVEAVFRYGGPAVEHWIGTGDALPSTVAGGLIWGLGAAVVLLWSFPAGVAFWLVQPRRRAVDARASAKGMSDADVPSGTSYAAWGDLAIGVALALVLPRFVFSGADDRYFAFGVFFFSIGVHALLGFGFYQASRRGRSVIEHRVTLTRDLALSLQVAAVIFLFALADTLALHTYNWLVANRDAVMRPAALSGVLAAVIWAVRQLATLLDPKVTNSWWARLPFDVLAGAGAFAIALALIVAWATLINWMVWNGAEALPVLLDATAVKVLGLIALVAGLMAITVGQFPAFINLSSLQSLYGARLTRAYLGASNGQRLWARMKSEGAQSFKGGSVAEPLPSDQLRHEAYYDPKVLAPLHIINVTINQTSDSNEQLVQRDRKGMPLAVLPTGFTIDGRYAAFGPGTGRSSIDRPLSIGEWIGTSGAAVATGLGRTTTPGLSLLMGLANVRLGTWWQSGLGPSTLSRREPQAHGALKRTTELLFATQVYLLSELTAQFHGLHRRWQYLSDGGHFENTAVYELLRPERGIRLIVACDDGADVGGRFGDLANLFRLARIDFSLELEVNEAVCSDAYLKDVFARADELVTGKSPRKCAMLIDVFAPSADRTRREMKCRIVVVKPRLIESVPLDVAQYAGAHPTFPNESTAQQFFDEAQWESYRRLGVAIGRTVFGLDGAHRAEYADALWRTLRWWIPERPSTGTPGPTRGSA